MRTVDDISLKEKDRLAIEEAVRLLKSQFPVAKVILFGSKAMGRADDESDIDLLILTTQTLNWRGRDKITDALFDIELEHEVVISTLVATVDEWERGFWAVLPIRQEIERNGAAA
ncbi:MAG: nucleotidyltransferase domain-containing protein [Actinomycetota bacterium]|nr:nucleotidyltransferase domain-containing protein [Actinomycetota bacterium]